MTANESLDLTNKRSKRSKHLSAVRQHLEAVHDSQMAEEERERNGDYGSLREDTNSVGADGNTLPNAIPVKLLSRMDSKHRSTQQLIDGGVASATR